MRRYKKKVRWTFFPSNRPKATLGAWDPNLLFHKRFERCLHLSLQKHRSYSQNDIQYKLQTGPIFLQKKEARDGVRRYKKKVRWTFFPSNRPKATLGAWDPNLLFHKRFERCLHLSLQKHRSYSQNDIRYKLQSGPIFLQKNKRETGIEPATFSLARRRSTTEPLAHIKYYVFVLTCDSHKW